MQYATTSTNTIIRNKADWHRLYSKNDVTFEILQHVSRWATVFESLHGPIRTRDFDELWFSLDSVKLKSGKRIDLPLSDCPAKRFIMDDVRSRA